VTGFGGADDRTREPQTSCPPPARECAIKKLAMGVTTFEEVLRVTAF
jgi:hypothetical protein